MLNAKDIRNVKFSKAVGGYKQEEVDILLDKVEADYELFERTLKDLQAKVEAAEKEVENYKNSQSSIQNVLVSAQKLADQIVDEAKAKSEQIIKNAEANIELITAREKEVAEEFERKAQERRDALQKELESMVGKAELKRDAIEKAAADSVKREQILFDKLKLEVSAFKAQVSRSYEEHLEILQKLPDVVPMNPENMVEAVAVAIDKAPNPESFFTASEEPVAEETVEIHTESVTDDNTEIVDVISSSKAAEDSDSGFTVLDADDID